MSLRTHAALCITVEPNAKATNVVLRFSRVAEAACEPVCAKKRPNAMEDGMSLISSISSKAYNIPHGQNTMMLPRGNRWSRVSSKYA